MEQIIIKISQFLILILMASYTFHCFAVFKFSNEFDRKGIYFRQIFFMILIHFFGFLSLYCTYGELKYFRAYLIQQLGIFFIIVIYRAIYPAANRLIINNMCMLLTVGFIILTRLSYVKAMRQFAIACGSIVITMIVPFLISRITFFEKFKWVYVGVGIASLAAVLIFSNFTYGSKINITIANYTFQPSEYVKIVYVFAIASILALRKNFKDIMISAIVAAAHIMLLVLSKDLGSAIIFFMVYLCMLFVSTRNYLYLIGGLFSAAGASVIGYKLFSHVRVRVIAFRDPFGHIEDAGYQIAQSLFAIGTGGWMGMGVGQGAPNNIPVVAADFVFAAICEEFGVLFGMFLILICVSCFIMFMNIAMRFRDRFFRLVAVGLAVSYAFQVLLTIGGVTKFIPLTGVTLPLVSYGGTSVAVTCCVFSVIQGMYIYRSINNKSVKERIKLSREFKLIEDIEYELDDEIADIAESETVSVEENSNVKSGTRNENNSTGVFGGAQMNTVMMDEAFKRAVEEGITFSESPDIDIDDI